MHRRCSREGVLIVAGARADFCLNGLLLNRVLSQFMFQLNGILLNRVLSQFMFQVIGRCVLLGQFPAAVR